MTAAPSPAKAVRARTTDIPDFDGLAHLYRWMEYATFGPWLWRCRCAFLTELNERRHALILGDGDGRFTARLLAANSVLCVDAVDVSSSMLRMLAAHAGAEVGRVHAYCADARHWQTASLSYDLIATHFFLDCLTGVEVRNLAERLRGSLAPGALWAISEFAVPQNWYGRHVAKPIVSALYAAFGLLTGLKMRTLPDHAAALRDTGFVLKKRKVWLRGLLISELWLYDRPAKDHP